MVVDILINCCVRLLHLVPILLHIVLVYNVFPKFVPFVRQCGKTLYSRNDHRLQYTTAHAHCGLGT